MICHRLRSAATPSVEPRLIGLAAPTRSGGDCRAIERESSALRPQGLSRSLFEWIASSVPRCRRKLHGSSQFLHAHVNVGIPRAA